MHVHLVFITKYRKSIFTSDDIDELHTIFTGIFLSFESELVEMDGERDHVHLLVNYPPKVSISKLVNSLKGASSRVMRKNNERFKRIYWKGVLWSPSYFGASCGGAPIEIVSNTSNSKIRLTSEDAPYILDLKDEVLRCGG